MRRLWSYIILTGASLVLMGSTFTQVFNKSTSNIEYSDGKELVFRISEKDETELAPETESGRTPAEIVSDSMIERLDSLKITNYEVVTESYDTVKVVLEQDTDSNYTNIQQLMIFNGTLALSSKLDDFLVNNEDTEHFVTDKAYLETKDNYPTVNIPVGDHFKDLYEIVKKYKEDNNTAAADSSGEGEEATYTYNMYLWHDYADGDTFSQTQQGSEDYDSRVANKIFMSFDISELIKLEEDEKEIETLTAYVNVQDVNGNSKYEASEVRKAFDTARFYVSLINSGELDYKVTYLYSNNVPAKTEVLVSIDEHVLWSSTLRATLICILIIALLLAVFFRLGALAVTTLSIGSIYAGIASLILFNAEFNAAGLIALCLVGLASIVCGVIYLTKIKDEAYRGRTIKKANSEAAKKSLLPIIDINVVLIVIGVFSYVFGSTIMRSFAIITVLGGIASLILNTLVLRGLMWLATNATKLTGKYSAFGIDEKNVPNVLKEEKQTYFGSYADKDFTKKKVPVGIIAALLFVAGLAGTIAFGVINKGNVYNNGGTATNSEIFVETTSKNTLITEQSVRSVLDNVYTYDKDEAKATSMEKQIEEIIYKTREDVGEDDDDIINYTYYIVKLNTTIDSNINAYYQEEGSEDKVYSTEFEGGINEMLTSYIGGEIDTEATVTLKEGNLVSTQQPEFMPVIWGTLVGIAVSAFYLLLRYRLSRGLASLIVPLGVSTIVAGFFAYTRLAVTSYAVVVVPAIALFSLFVSILFMNRERELVLEDKAQDKSVENRKAIMVRATALSFTTILLVTALAFYIGLNFFGFGAIGNSWLFLIFIVGVLATLLFNTTLFGPISQMFYKLFSKVNTEKITKIFKHKRKKKATPVVRSAEPEERTFIGIND